MTCAKVLSRYSHDRTVQAECGQQQHMIELDADRIPSDMLAAETPNRETCTQI